MVKNVLSRKLGLALLLITAAPLYAAESGIHYRWTNNNGGTVYSDRPPPMGVDYEVVSSDSGLKRVVDGEEGAVPLEVDPSPGNNFEQVDTRNTADSSKNEVLCEKAQMNLIALEGANVVQVTGADGEPKELSAEEREVARQTAKAQISVYCQ